jgi:hypothetical protein
MNQSVVNSTIIGLGTFGYISSATLYSSIQSYNFVSSSTLQSSLIGLGSLGYISSSQLQSSVRGLGSIGYISVATLYSSIQSYNFVSSSTLQSSLIGLGSLGYISSASLISSLIGLGTLGYISSATLYSSIQSYNFVSSSTLQSSLIGLGTLGYVSSSQLTSTVRGLGSIGYVSSLSLISSMSNWSLYPAKTNVNMSYSSILNANTINTSSIYVSSISTTIINLTGSAAAGIPTKITFTDLALNTTDTLRYRTDNTLYFTGGLVISNILEAASFVGDGSQLVNLNAISTSQLTSTVTGLGTIGYISTSQLTSTVTALGTTATWANYPAISNVDIAGSNINNVGVFNFQYYDGLYMSEYVAPGGFIGIATLGLYSNLIPFVGPSEEDFTCVNLYNVKKTFYCDPAFITPYNSIFSSNGVMCYSNDVTTNQPIVADWSQYAAQGVLDMNNNEIQNLGQTTTVNSATTNLVVSQSYSNIIDATIFNSGSFTQLLTTFPTTLQYKNTNTIFTNVWKVSFSFSGGLQTNDTNYGYYFSLSNVTQSIETTGQNFNSITPKCITSNFIDSLSLSDSYTDAYNLSSWLNNDYYCVLLYFQGTLCNNFKNILIPCVYNSFIQPSIQYGF